MPIANVIDAVEVEKRLDDILDKDDAERRVGHIRTLFVETLDWQYVDGLISLHNARNDNLPSDAHLIASRDGTSAVYIPLTGADTDRIAAATVNAAARALNDTLAGDLLLLFTNQAGDQFHIVRPDLTQARPRLQRMVARRGEHHRTIVQQLANMWDDYGRKSKSVHQAIVSAFSVEPVTELFFNEYRSVFGDAKNGISGFADERELHLFTQTLFNRLMFVYFISRKGWLTFDGDTDYLNALRRDYESSKTSDSNFYWDRLRLLFFAGLNNSKSENLTEYPNARQVIGSVPFLNGGLFEETDMDVRSGIYVPDAVILPILQNLFNRFNFTVTESTPYDTEVAVDPEMLGKVFEELVNERHESGAYYTPRPVVSFMCREALKGFLSGAHTGLNNEAIAEFVDRQNTDGIAVADARKVAAALERVTVVDPACGSGAYLLGMIQELVDLQTTLFNAGADSKSIYDLKLEIIRRNLYGADIDDFAVNIAMLRLWLSLVIEYEGEKPEPLPNLDFKIACGDSLLAPNPDPQQYGDFTAHLMRESDVGELKAQYMQARAQVDKDRLRAEIVEAQTQIKDTLGDAAVGDGAIDWRVEFAEVMGDGGFDIVIGNPPYVEARSSSISKSLKDAYRARVQSDWGETLPGGSDLLMYFYPRSVQLLKRTGYGCFITQNAWLSTDYGKKFQNFSIGRFSFIRVIDSTTRFFTNVKSQNINAVITAFTRDDAPEIEYGIADKDLNFTIQGTIPARSRMKWGHLLEMPSFLQEILAMMSAMSVASKPITFGQGLNFPLRDLNQSRADIDVIVKGAHFVALSGNGKIRSVSKNRWKKIPALIMPRGVGGRYYCMFNTCKAFSYSAVELYLPDELWETDTHYCLWAYMNSSLMWLFREITGRKNLGGGLLKAEATDMKMLPVDFDFGFADEAMEVFQSLKYREPLPVSEELYTKEHLLIDDVVTNYFGISDRQEEIRQCLIERVHFRHSRARR